MGSLLLLDHGEFSLINFDHEAYRASYQHHRMLALRGGKSMVEVTGRVLICASRLLLISLFEHKADSEILQTDILGPYGVGFALGTLGWGPGESKSRTIHALEDHN